MNNLVRQALTDLKIAERYGLELEVETTANYFNRVSDHPQIRDKIKDAHGVGIIEERDPNRADSALTSVDRYVTYAKDEFCVLVDTGAVQAISIGFGQRVTNALANMFTEQGNRLTLNVPGREGADVKLAEDLLNYHRSAGGYQTALVKGDKTSVQCGSSAIFPQFWGGHINYQSLNGSVVRPFYAERIKDNGEMRAVDNADPEDCTAILIRLSQVDLERWNYLAIFGRSELYPLGRHVQFTAPYYTVDIPGIKDKDVIEYELDGKLCNPLSYYAEQNPDLDVPEYPVVILDGGITEGSGMMPYSSSLYEDCLWFDDSASRILSASGDACRGTLVLKRDHSAKGSKAPKKLIGAIDLLPGQDIMHIPHDAPANEIGMRVLERMMINLAAGYGVPDYMVVPEDHTFDASSGIALQVKTRQLKKNREYRVDTNQLAIRKLFEIEKAYISLYSGTKPAEINLLNQCEQIWDAGELTLPENKKEQSERVEKMLQLGIYDTIEAIRDIYKYTTDEEAIEHYEKLKARAQKYPSLAEKEEQLPAKKQLSLLKNRNVQR